MPTACTRHPVLHGTSPCCPAISPPPPLASSALEEVRASDYCQPQGPQHLLSLPKPQPCLASSPSTAVSVCKASEVNSVSCQDPNQTLLNPPKQRGCSLAFLVSLTFSLLQVLLNTAGETLRLLLSLSLVETTPGCWGWGRGTCCYTHTHTEPTAPLIFLTGRGELRTGWSSASEEQVVAPLCHKEAKEFDNLYFLPYNIKKLTLLPKLLEDLVG